MRHVSRHTTVGAKLAQSLTVLLVRVRGETESLANNIDT